MQINILYPNFSKSVDPDLGIKLRKAGRVFIEQHSRPLSQIPSLYSSEEKILGIEPTFTDWQLPNPIISKIPNLKAICLQSKSFDWIDTDFVSKKSIVVTNTRDFHTEAVTEWAMMMAQNLARQIPLVAKSDWRQDGPFRGTELAGKVAGVIGMGTIGTRIAGLCQGQGMRVQYWSKHSRNNQFWITPLKKLMQTSDIIFPALAINAQTKKLFSDNLLGSMKRSAIFVSIVRPELYNHKLLLKMAANNRIFGYGFEEEGGQKFAKYAGNIWAGPALAWTTDESLRKNSENWIECIIQATQGHFPNRVN